MSSTEGICADEQSHCYSTAEETSSEAQEPEQSREVWENWDMNPGHPTPEPVLNHCVVLLPPQLAARLFCPISLEATAADLVGHGPALGPCVS